MSRRSASGLTCGRFLRRRMSSAGPALGRGGSGRSSATGAPSRVTTMRSPCSTRRRTSPPLFRRSRTVTVSMRASVSPVRRWYEMRSCHPREYAAIEYAALPIKYAVRPRGLRITTLRHARRVLRLAWCHRGWVGLRGTWRSRQLAPPGAERGIAPPVLVISVPASSSYWLESLCPASASVQ